MNSVQALVRIIKPTLAPIATWLAGDVASTFLPEGWRWLALLPGAIETARDVVMVIKRRRS